MVSKESGGFMPSSIGPFSAFVLAGGKSSRMQQDKALLRYRDHYLIEYAIAVLQHLTSDIRIIGDPHNYEFLKRPVIPDRVTSHGPLGGIYTGLNISPCRYNLFLACDMPLMKPEFFRLLLERIGDADAAAVRLKDGKVEPLAAVYSKSGLPAIEENMALQCFKITDFLNRARVIYLGEEGLSEIGLSARIFTNINTPEDLLSLESIS
jgi:molybdopterin-guanine dinucleotide biosynthesis protein A